MFYIRLRLLTYASAAINCILQQHFRLAAAAPPDDAIAAVPEESLWQEAPTMHPLPNKLTYSSQ